MYEQKSITYLFWGHKAKRHSFGTTEKHKAYAVWYILRNEHTTFFWVAQPGRAQMVQIVYGFSNTFVCEPFLYIVGKYADMVQQ